MIRFKFTVQSAAFILSRKIYSNVYGCFRLIVSAYNKGISLICFDYLRHWFLFSIHRAILSCNIKSINIITLNHQIKHNHCWLPSVIRWLLVALSHILLCLERIGVIWSLHRLSCSDLWPPAAVRRSGRSSHGPHHRVIWL